MKTKIIEDSYGRKVVDLTLERTGQDSRLLQQAFRRVSHQYKLDGFRTGKVPLEMVEPLVGGEIFYDLFPYILNSAYDHAELEYDPLARLSDLKIDYTNEGEPVVLRIYFDYPTDGVTYKALNLNIDDYEAEDVEPYQVDDEDVEEELQNLLIERPIKTPVETAAEGNLVDVEARLYLVKENSTSFLTDVRAYFLASENEELDFSFNSELLGVRKGDELIVRRNFEDYPFDLIYKIKVNEVVEDNPREDLESFVAEYTDAESLEEFKDFLREYLQAEVDLNHKNQLAADIVEKIIEDYPIVLKDELVESFKEFFTKGQLNKGVNKEALLAEFSDEEHPNLFENYLKVYRELVILREIYNQIPLSDLERKLAETELMNIYRGFLSANEFTTEIAKDIAYDFVLHDFLKKGATAHYYNQLKNKEEESAETLEIEEENA